MSITYVLSTLRRRWLILLLALLIGALAGAAFAVTTPERYKATTSLVVSPVVSNPLTGSREDINIRTEQEILGSREVARRAAETLGVDDGGSSLSGDVEVAAPMGSQILQVTVQGDTPQQAADSADAVATAYLDLRRDAATSVTESYLEGVNQQIEDLRAEPSAPANDGLIEQLQLQRANVTPSDQEPGRIIGEAIPPTSPSGPSLLITVTGGAMAGLLLGIAAAVLRERLDPWVRSADRLELAAGPLSVIASRHDDDEFWGRLADEAVRRSQIDLGHEPVRMLLHAASPMPTRVAADGLLDAARWILSDIGTGLSLSGADADVERTKSAPVGCVVIVPSGMSRTSLIQSARRSDVAVIVATPRSSLQDVRDLVTALSESRIEVVVGLTREPVQIAISSADEEHPVVHRRMAADVDTRQLEPTPVAG